MAHDLWESIPDHLLLVSNQNGLLFGFITLALLVGYLVCCICAREAPARYVITARQIRFVLVPALGAAYVLQRKARYVFFAAGTLSYRRSNHFLTGTVHFVAGLSNAAFGLGDLVIALEVVVIVLGACVFRLGDFVFGLGYFIGALG